MALTPAGERFRAAAEETLRTLRLGGKAVAEVVRLGRIPLMETHLSVVIPDERSEESVAVHMLSPVPKLAAPTRNDNGMTL